ncbi:unnamed protein product [Closterium sp. Yama58-4]|nr:unnamed protein product [Closterium sp. Yama58-4]
MAHAWLRLRCWFRAIYWFPSVDSPAISSPRPAPHGESLFALPLVLAPLLIRHLVLNFRTVVSLPPRPRSNQCRFAAHDGPSPPLPPRPLHWSPRAPPLPALLFPPRPPRIAPVRPAGIHGARPQSSVRRPAVPRRFCLLSRGFESLCLPFLAGHRFRLLLLQLVVVVKSPSVRLAVLPRLHPSRTPYRSYPLMVDDALGLVASALAEAIPGEAPGDQVPGLLRAYAVLAGRGSSSQSSRGRHAAVVPPHSPPALPSSASPASSAFVGVRAFFGATSFPFPGSGPAVATVTVAAPATVSACSSGGSSAAFFPVAASSVCPRGCSAGCFGSASPPQGAFPQLFLGGREIPIPWEVLSTPQPTVAPAASAAALDERWSRGGECPPAEWLRRVERRVATVGTVLELLASVLDQLHLGLVRGRVACPPLLKRERAVVVTAAWRMMGSFPQMGLETGSPGVGSGPGPSAVRRLASSVRRVPLDLVPAASALLRWLDGRLALILAD